MTKALWTRVLVSLVFLNAAMLHAGAPASSLVQVAELTPSARAANDWFGISIAVSGNTVVVGDFDANIETFGAVYVYVKPASGWTNMTQVAKLTSSDNGEGFGTSVAISGNTVVVGAANTSNFNAPAAGPGAAYVFVEPAGGWADMTETAKLTASDGKPGDAFGDSVSISANTIAVGAFFATDSSGNSFAGKAYAFARPGGGWSGNLNETAKLTANDSQLLNYMGASIATNGNTIVAGSYGHNNFQGTAYVFAEPSGGWASMTQTAELRAPNAVSGDGFGQSAAISGSAVAIGAPGATVGSNTGQGAAYFFVKPSTGWKNSLKASELTASDGAKSDNFGVSISISGSTIVAGAPKSTTPGSAYVFGP